ncbi:rhodanese-related sulfurtransferase [Aestuariivirga sp.]|uniref:oxygen-dependent tRNA uridine(34) hydroxylase TrhO n=1 Tax=Aestuariivirga sp. TaxID=2650926 RepID=UPI003782DE0B
MTLTVSAFYKFIALPDFRDLQQPLLDCCRAHAVRGTILLAPEGINGTVAGGPVAIASVMAFIRKFPALHDLEAKSSHADAMPFGRLKIKLKKEIVTMGIAGLDPRHGAGHYVEPEDWNALISEPDVLLIDTRNAFEVAAGSFRGAIDPVTRSFSEFPAYVERTLSSAPHHKIAMFCTGGIRCEKATSYLRAHGFKHVYQLRGGILNYLEKVPATESLWWGSCFVFDEREGLGHGLAIEPPARR